MISLAARMWMKVSAVLEGWVQCLSNKLCIGADGNTLRGSCTDKNWASPECAMFCLGSDTSFCCDHNSGCCNSGVGRFAVLPSNPKVWATWNRKENEYTVVGTVFTGESTSTTALVTSDTSSSAKVATSTHATTASEASASSGSASDTPVSSDEPTGMSTGAKAGIGAGIGVGAILAATVVYLLWRIRKNKKATEGNNHLPPTYYGPCIESYWQQSHYAPGVKEFQPHPPQELHGQALQGYNIRAELPVHN